MRSKLAPVLGLLVAWACCVPLAAQDFHWIGAPGPAAWPPNPTCQAMLDAPLPGRGEPLFGVDAGAIWLARSGATPQTLVVDENNNELLNASDLESDLASGVRITLDFFNLSDDYPGCDVQARYFRVQGIQSSETLTSTQVVPRFFGGVPADPIGTVTSHYDTDLQNVEYNLRYRHARTPGIRWLAGLRYLQMEEAFRFDTTNGGAVPSGFFSDARNELFGVQVGADWTFWTNGRSRLFTSGKYAVLHNDVDGQARAADAAGGPLQIHYGDQTTSGLFDFEIGGAVAITRWCSVKLAYQGLFAQDWATATEQSRAFSLTTGNGQVSYADPQFHGLNLSAELAW